MQVNADRWIHVETTDRVRLQQNVQVFYLHSTILTNQLRRFIKGDSSIFLGFFPYY